MLQKRPSPFRKRTLHQQIRSRTRFRRVQELDECLQLLRLLGLIRKDVRIDSRKGGRPSDWYYHKFDRFNQEDIQQLKALL